MVHRFHGGYCKVYGGWPGNAFIALTGGVAEWVKTAETNAASIYARVRNALNTGSIIATSVPVSPNFEFASWIPCCP